MSPTRHFYAATLAAMLALHATPAHGQDKPAKAPTTSAKTDTGAMPELVKAAKFSNEGVSLVLVLGKNQDMKSVAPVLSGVVQGLKEENVKYQPFGLKSSDTATYAYLIVKGAPFRNGTETGYKVEEWGSMGADAIKLYKENFPIKPTPTTPESHP